MSKVGTVVDRLVSASDVTVKALEVAYERIQNVANTSIVNHSLQVGSQVIEAVVPFVEKPSWLRGVQATINVSKALATKMAVNADKFFAGDQWVSPYSHDFSDIIIGSMHGMPTKLLKTDSDDFNIVLVDIGDNVTVGYSLNNKANVPSPPYVMQNDIVKARSRLKELTWKMFGSSSLVLKHAHKFMRTMTSISALSFDIDETFRPLPSELASYYTKYLQKCIDGKVNRSFLLYGPPGTGKSTLARTLVHNLNLRSFRIRVGDVSSLDNSTLFEAIHIFEPDAIILDDFDRAHNQANMLEVLEFFRNKTKLVIATVNDREALDEALLRPERFDELVEVDHMDEAVIRHVLGEGNQDAFEEVRQWPIAFIAELVKRRRFMQGDEAIAATRELAGRVERLVSYKDRDDITRMREALLNEAEDTTEASSLAVNKPVRKRRR